MGRSESHRHRARNDDLKHVSPAVTHAMALDHPDPAAAIRALAVDGVDRVIEVSFSDNVDLDAAVLKNDGIIAAYAAPDGIGPISRSGRCSSTT